MAFNSEQLSYAGYLAMNFEHKQKPEDLYNTKRPLLKLLNAKKKTFPGGKQYIVEKLRKTNDSNFQWSAPDGEVTYNRKRTIDQANFVWGTAHDGFSLSEEELLQNGISMTDDRGATPTASEKVNFINLLNENNETLRLGFNEKFDYDLHLDGTQDVDAIPGLDALVSTTPTTGTVGGINRATAGNEYWRNYADLNIASTAGLLTERMELAFRHLTRVGGYSPDVILCGYKAYDAFKKDAKTEINRQIIVTGTSGAVLDPSVNKVFFNGVEVVWDPVLDDLQANLSAGATFEWDKRIYLLNSRFIHLRPAEGQDMIVRKPPRAYNRYTHYWGLTWRGGMTITRPSAMGVLTID